MKSTTVLLTTLLASAAIAQPHRAHLAKHHQKHRRDAAIEWQTEWVTEIETVDCTSTVWVQPGGEPTSASVAPTTTATPVAPSSTPIPAQFFQGASTASTSTSTSVYVAPAPAPVTTSTSVYVAPVPTTTTSSTPVDVAAAPAAVSTTTSTPLVVVAPTTTASAPAATTSSSSSTPSNGQCSTGSPCAGDITHYDAGLGACGWVTDGDAENVVALPHELMGTQSNGNPYCGRTMTIKCTKTGKVTTAKVVDKCMGCVGFSIDLSNKAYAELDDMGIGREGATWWWN